jgi:cytochrome c553
VKRTLTLAGLALVAMSPAAYAQNTAVITGGPHDLTSGSALRNSNTSIAGQTCVFCHTPHGGANSIPLWNRSNPTGATYQLYTSSTSDVTTTGTAIAASVSP